MPFTWDPRIARYRDTDTGRLVTRSAVLDIVEDSIAASVAAPPVTIDGIATMGSDFLAQMVGNELLDPGDWNNFMRGEIKREYIRQYLLGIGGVEQMTPARWGQIGGLLGRDYKILNAFTAEIATGELSEAAIRARAAMYIRSAGEAYERANQIVQVAAGMTEMRWALTPGAKHCETCLEFADMGWVKIADDPYGGCVPKRGCTICLCITTPMCRVLTDAGYVPMMDVRVGDLVFTHKRNWKPVTALVIKRSLPGTRDAVIVSPSGQSIGCTADHLWYTPDGWRNSLDIDNSLLSMYYLPIKADGGNDGKESMREMRLPFTAPEQADCVQIVSLGVSLREYQRLSGSAVQKLFTQRQGQDSVGQQERWNLEWYQKGGESKTYTIKGLRPAKVAGAGRRASLQLVLAGGRGSEAHNLPVSMGVDYGERSDTRRLRLASRERGCDERQFGQLEVDDEECARQASRQDCSQESTIQDGRVDLSKSQLRDHVQSLPAFTEWSPQILFPGVLTPGTAIYDLTVEDDYSFIIEGLAAHNTNCQCHLEYRKSTDT